MLYVVLTLEGFELEPVNFPYPVKVDTRKMIGFLPVFASLEDLREEYPDANYTRIQRREGKSPDA